MRPPVASAFRLPAKLGAPTSSSTTSKGPCSSKPSGCDHASPRAAPPRRAAPRGAPWPSRARPPRGRAGWPRCPPRRRRRARAAARPGRRPAWLKSASWAVVKTSGRPPACGPVEPVRDRHRRALVHHGELGLPAAADDRHHPVALREALRRPGPGRPPRRPARGPGMSGGEPGRRGIAALALQHVGAVEAGGPDADQHLAGPGLGVRALLHDQPPVLDRHRAHAAKSSPDGTFGADTSIRPKSGLWWNCGERKDPYRRRPPAAALAGGANRARDGRPSAPPGLPRPRGRGRARPAGPADPGLHGRRRLARA